MTNLEIMKELTKETDFKIIVARGRNAKDFSVTYIPTGEVIATINKEYFNDFVDENLSKEIINTFYSEHTMAKLKEEAKALERERDKLLKKTLKEGLSDDEILANVHMAREIKARLKDMKPSLEYTKEVAKALYQQLRDKEVRWIAEGLI